MSADDTSKATAAKVTREIHYPEIDEFTILEAGLRIPEQRRGNTVKVGEKKIENAGAFAPKRQGLPGEQTKWMPSATRPKGAAMRRISVPMNTEGFVPIPETDDQGSPVRAIFDDDGGSLMLKVVSPQPLGYFVVPVRKRPPQREQGSRAQGWNPLYGYDPTNNYPGRLQGQRENGDFVYSIPVEGLLPQSEELTTRDILRGSKHTKYFFLVRFLADATYKPREWVKMEIDKVTVLRGNEHFRVMLEDYWRSPNNLSVHIPRIQNLLDSESRLQELPILEAVRLYLADLDRKR